MNSRMVIETECQIDYIKFMSFDNKKFSNIIKKLIKFKSGTTRIPIKDASWEELIWATLVFMYGDKNINWDSQSHEKSVDIKAKINNVVSKISAKGGIIKENLLTISSYRLTTFNKLKDKLNFIEKQHNNFDFYLICARKINKTNKTINYLVIKTPAMKLAPPVMLSTKNWKRTKSGYELKKGIGFNAKIIFKMSDQLWYSISLDYFSNKEKLINISIPIKELGKGLIDFLKKTN